jgi:hypothetical protein
MQRARPRAQNIHFEHFANPMVHPVTRKTILSYKKLMHDPAAAEVWQTAFGKDFGGMAQGDNKTGQKGMNAMFVMTHDEIVHTIREKKNSPLPILLLITDLKRKIRIKYGSRQEGTWSHTMASSASEPHILTLQNYTGTL